MSGLGQVPCVKESLDDLRADGIARQVGDFIEVISPAGVKGLRSGSCELDAQTEAC